MTVWAVMLEAAADDESAEELAAEQVWPLLEALRTHSPAGGGGGHRYDVQFDVEAGDAAAAVSKAQRLWRRAVNVSGLPPWPIVQATASTAAEQDRLLSAPDWPQLVGVSEIAALLGTTRNRAWQVTRKPDFPQPLADLAAGPVWALPTVATFLEQWRRRPGPPPGAKQNASNTASG